MLAVLLISAAGAAAAALPSPASPAIEIEAPESYKIHSGAVKVIVFTPDSKKIISAGDDGIINIIDPADGRPEKYLRHGSPVTAGAIGPGSRFFASAGMDDTLKIWDIRTGRLMKSIKEKPENIRSLSFSAGGNFLAAGGEKGAVIYRMKDYKKVETLKSPERAAVVDFSGGGRRFLTAFEDFVSVRNLKDPGAVSRFFKNDTISFGEEEVFKQGMPVYSALFSRDGYYFAITGGKSFTSLWRSEDGLLLWTAMPSSADVWDAVFSPDSNFILLAAGKDGIIMLDVLKGRKTAVIRSEEADVLSAAVSGNGKYIAAGLRSGTVQVRAVSGMRKYKFENLYIAAAAAAAAVLLIIIIYYLRKFIKRKKVKDWEV